MDQAKPSRPAPPPPAALADALADYSDAELAATLRGCEHLITYARYLEFLYLKELVRRDLAASVDVA
jgi:hypothetical protein